jgi:hypothetical protein
MVVDRAEAAANLDERMGDATQSDERGTVWQHPTGDGELRP